MDKHRFELTEEEIRLIALYRNLFRVLSLFKDRCDYFGLDSRSHVLDLMDEIEKGNSKSDNTNRPSIN